MDGRLGATTERFFMSDQKHILITDFYETLLDLNINGVSDHKKSYLGIDATREVLGYTPQDGTAKRR